MGFFSAIQYAPQIKSNPSFLTYAENAADFCRAPVRWVSEIWGGGQKYVIPMTGRLEIIPNESKGLQKLVRLVLGAILCIPGFIAGAAFMGIAYINEEIRLKHKCVTVNMTQEESARLRQLVEERNATPERKGCDPITCSLCSLVCLVAAILYNLPSATAA